METTKEKQFNLNDRNFRIAFSFESKYSEKLVYDPRYVRWIFRQETWKDGIAYEKIIPHHVCTDQDFAKFYPIRSDEASKM